MITGSIVVFKNSKEDLKNVISSFLGFKKKSFLFVVDNSPDNSLHELCQDSRIKYIFNNSNIGYGAAHNIAIKEAYKLDSTYHIILNPDLYFNSSIINDLLTKANLDPSIGLLMPKILYPNGQIQYLCKLIPSPLDLIARRFLFSGSLKTKLSNKYELKFMSYEKESEIPVLSGCFMFIRTSILKKINGFDERFFMYLEDVDLCRRVGALSKLIYFPKVNIVHNYEKGSYKNKKLFAYHIISAIKYFNKWGWINTVMVL